MYYTNGSVRIGVSGRVRKLQESAMRTHEEGNTKGNPRVQEAHLARGRGSRATAPAAGPTGGSLVASAAARRTTAWTYCRTSCS